MFKNNKIIVSLLLLFSMIVTACGSTPDIGNILENGADNFADGKEESQLALMSADDILDNLMNNFADAHDVPQGNPITSDEADKAKNEADADQIIGNDGNLVISSKNELKKAMHQMFDETKEVLTFSCDNGYHPDINDITVIYGELEREDVYDVICTDAYSFGGVPESMTLTLMYDMGVDELKAMKAETPALVQQAKSQIDITGLDAYGIVCAVNDYLCDTIVYPSQEPYAADSHTAYSAFKKGSAVCDGYSRAAKMLLNEFGIECDMEVGTCTNGGGHAWNLVKMDDGKWYQMDVTWNDGGAEWDTDARTEYLLVTDDFMKQSRVWDFTLYPATPPTPYKAAKN